MLSEIVTGTFNGLSSLMTLFIDSTQLHTIQRASLAGLSSLETLSVIFCFELPSSVYLIIQYSHSVHSELNFAELSTIPSNAFAELPSFTLSDT